MKKILFVGAEATPFAATGGLGDVLGSLPAELKAADPTLDVRVVMPLYSAIKVEYREKMTKLCEFHVNLAWRKQYCGIWSLEQNGVIYYFVDNEYYFKRATLYGNYDDGERFAFFSRAVIEMFAQLDYVPDILHANDWQTALAVIYLKRKYAHLSEYRGISALFTIHNIDYQGVFDFSILGDVFELPEWDRSIVEYNGCINLLKGAIACADMVNTVSPTYSREILTEFYASGLHHILHTIDGEGKLTGIINGIDVDYYNSQKDTE